MAEESTFDREKFVSIAKLAEAAERYDDMAEAMKNVATKVGELTADERILLSEAYKNRILSCRASWKILSSKLEKETTNPSLITEYREKVEAEMNDICSEVVSILNEHLIPFSKIEDPTSATFYYKMKGDYSRYLAEFKSGSAKKEAADEAIEAYESAMLIAKMEFPPTHTIRLGVALNLSVFYYEILGLPDRACKMAREALDEAIPRLDKADGDSIQILELLMDNVTQWMAEKSGDASGNNDGDNIQPDA